MFTPEKLVELLTVRGITQEEFAARLGYRPETVSRVLNERQPLSRKFAIKAADELGIPLYWLRADEPAEPVEAAAS